MALHAIKPPDWVIPSIIYISVSQSQYSQTDYYCKKTIIIQMNNGVFNSFRSRRIELNTPLNNTILFWICNLLNTHYGCCARCVCCKCCIRCGCSFSYRLNSFSFRYRLNSCFKVIIRITIDSNAWETGPVLLKIANLGWVLH